MPHNNINGFWRAFLLFLKRGAWPIIIISLLLAVLAVFYSFTHLKMITSRNELVASDLRLIRLSEDLDRQFGSRDNLMVVVENGSPQRSIQFAEALAQELRQHPKEFPQIFYRVDPETFKHWALLYLNTKDFKQFKAKLGEHLGEMEAMAQDPSLPRFFSVVNEEITRALLGHLFTGFLEDEQDREKIPDLGLLNATLRNLYLFLVENKPFASPLKALFPGELSDLSQEGYFFTDNEKYLLFLVTREQDGFTTAANSLKLLRELVAKVQINFPGIKAGVTGPSALEADEMNGAMADINLASWLSLLGQMLIMVIFFRSLMRTMVQGLVLFIGLCWTFGVATLVVGHLNLLSIVFGPLMLGIAVDFGIHWYSRLEEEQGARSHCNPWNLSSTVRGATPGILYASLAAVISVAPLIFTGFKGLAELGLIITLGILLHIFASLVLLPSLAIVTEKCPPGFTPEPAQSLPNPFLHIRWRQPWLVLAGGVLVTLAGAVSLWFVPFDLNPLHLQNQNTESVVWELKLIRDSKYSTSYGTMVACDLEELPVKTEALKKLPSVSQVESIMSFLPSDLEMKQKAIQELAPTLTRITFPDHQNSPPVQPQELATLLGRIRFKLSQAEETDWKPEHKPTQKQLAEANQLLARLAEVLATDDPQVMQRLKEFEGKFFYDLKDKWELLQANVKGAAAPPQIGDLPQEVRSRFISSQGTYLIRIFPSQDIWNPGPLTKFVKELREVDPNVVGDPVLLYVFTNAFRNACLWAAGMALLGIALMLWFLLRSLKLTILALIPLLVGTALTLSLMWLFGIPFNQANVLFLPLILGEGIEYGIIILVRWQTEETARTITLPASTAKGVLLAALTTAVGFGSLMISGHRGTFSLGLLSTVGSISVLLAALSVLPALLRLLESRYEKPVSSPHPFSGLRRWLGHMVKKGVS